MGVEELFTRPGGKEKYPLFAVVAGSDVAVDD